MNISIILKFKIQDESLSTNENINVYIVTKTQENNPFLLWRTLPDMN